MNIIFFTEISPFPINGGERIRSYGLLKSLSLLGHKVFAVIQNSDEVDLTLFQIDNVELIQYKYSKGGSQPTQFFSLNREVESVFNKILKSNSIDLVILDFYLAGRYITYFKSKRLPVVIGTHNVESNLIWQRPSNGLIGSFRKLRNYIFMRLHEAVFYRKAQAIIAVSDEDLEFYTRFLNVDRIFMIPNFLDEGRYGLSLERTEKFVMTANFGAYMNFEGLRWFLENVWTQEIDSKHELLLVGKKSTEAFNRLQVSSGFNNVKAIGAVEDTLPYIASAKAVFIPLLHGSGSRLKCLEAMALKTPIIATSKGVEGIKSQNVILANDVNTFKKHIQTFVYDPRIGLALYEDFLSEYSLGVNMKRVKILLETVIGTI